MQHKNKALQELVDQAQEDGFYEETGEESMIIQYVRERDLFTFRVGGKEPHENEPVGVVVCTGLNEEGEPKIGWSLKHPDDKFNKKRGLEIATNRAEYFKKGTSLINNFSKKADYYESFTTLARAKKWGSLFNTALKVYRRAQKYYGQT